MLRSVTGGAGDEAARPRHSLRHSRPLPCWAGEHEPGRIHHHVRARHDRGVRPAGPGQTPAGQGSVGVIPSRRRVRAAENIRGHTREPDMTSDLVGVAGFEPAAFSSRSQLAMRTAMGPARLTWAATSVDVRWRLLLSMVIVTRFVTHSLGGNGLGPHPPSALLPVEPLPASTRG